METLRDKLIHHGASVQLVARICSLRLNASYRYLSEVESILAKIRLEVKLRQIRKHQALDKFRK